MRIAAAVDLDADEVGRLEEPPPGLGVVAAPVSVRMPRAIISRTTSAFAAPVAASTDLAEVTATTRPGYGPGIPGVAAGLYADTTRTLGRPGRVWKVVRPRRFAATSRLAAAVAEVAAASRRTKARRSMTAAILLQRVSLDAGRRLGDVTGHEKDKSADVHRTRRGGGRGSRGNGGRRRGPPNRRRLRPTSR